MKRWTVGDVMTHDVFWVSEDTPYHDIVAKLADTGVSALPVLDHARRVLGVVSEADLLRKIELGSDDRTFLRPSRREAKAKSAADNAAGLMTAPAVTISAEASLAEAARLLAQHNVKRLPVTDGDGRLKGIVSRADLLKGYLRPDADIQHDIVDGVIRQTLWLDPAAITVTVLKGEVQLAGQADRKSSAGLIAYLAKAVPGVVEVKDELSWRYDDTQETASAYFRSHPFSAEIPR